MTEPAPSMDDRLARLEARVADLERRLAPDPPAPDPQVPPGYVRTPSGGIKRVSPPGEVEAEMAAYRKRIGADIPPIGAAALRQMQIAEGADPTSTWTREEIERMREE